MRFRLGTLLFIFIALFSLRAQTIKIIESNSERIKIELSYSGYYHIKEKVYQGKKFVYIEKNGISFRKPGEPWIPTQYYNFGLPFNKVANYKILNITQEKIPNISVLPYPDSVNQPIDRLKFDPAIYKNNKFFPLSPVNITGQFIMRYVKGASLEVAPYQYNSITRELIFNKKILVQINFDTDPHNQVTTTNIKDKFTEDFVATAFINPKEAKEFIGKPITVRSPNHALVDTFWYNPNKDYYKIFVQTKGLYKVTYNDLISAGVPPNNGIHQGNFELINNGVRIPIEIVDVNKNDSFDSSDYFTFVGLPPQPTTPYTYFNIYNLSNVYWFSYQAESVFNYKKIDGFPTNFDNQITTTLQTIHYEKDSLYERLGYAPDDQRDFWLWANTEARSGQEYEIFTYWITDSLAYKINPGFPQATVRANLQGITNESCTGFIHSTKIKFNTNIVAGQKWNGQNSVTFEGKFNFSFNGSPGIPLYLDKNKFEISMDGDICTSDGNDIARVNWFELDFWRWNNVKGNSYTFLSPPDRLGRNTYYLFNWYSDNMKIYIPSRGELISNPRIVNDADRSVQFTDSIGSRTEYFCYSGESFQSPDSIRKSHGSNLRDISQGADYIIITHPAFISVAQKLADFRSNNLAGFTNPRVKIVNVFDIYDEFSFGLLDPFALQYFVKYAFENWQGPAPTFVTLLGDMSYDYRPVYASNMPNFVPSIPYQAYTFGQAPSDNLIVCIEGDDIVPDLAIGRLSCDNVEEGNALVDKIINYPADNGKNWKENVLLMAGGVDAQDEADFGFNDQSEFLYDTYLKPNGITASKVYRYPDKPEYFQYQGGEPEIRDAFNKGSVVANYYGHGGGGQWDLTFTNDDIYLLNNGGRLPFISSVTCYTAHFDNQDCFGEKFNKVIGKGSIAFFGSTGLTWWQAGTYLNDYLFDEIFNRKNNLIGSAILNCKTRASVVGYIASQVALLSLLGDPALELDIPKYADFQVSSTDFTIKPPNPVKGDTVLIKVYLNNLGVIFNDSVTVDLYQTQIDSSHKIGTVKRNGFGELDSTIFTWIPDKAGLYNFIIEINNDNHIEELDHSDNKATSSLAVFDFSEPNIVRPLNGYTTSSKNINFTLVDIGNYIGRQFNYRIMIDTSLSLNSSTRLLSPVLLPVNGIVKWNINLPVGEYFWKASIFDNVDTNSSKLFTFSINNSAANGFLAKNKQLNLFDTYNMSYNPANNSLVINTALLPPKPSNSQFLDSINIKLPADANGITAFTTDGSYYYFANIPYYSGGTPSKIYKIGNGLNGTIKGNNYGSIPGISINIKSEIFYYSDGFIYAATGDKNSLLRIDKSTGDTLRIMLGDTLLPSYDGLLQDSSYYVTSDGNYVYNLSSGCGNNRNQYTMRIFDPHNSWKKIGNDIIFTGSSARGFSGFIVIGGYLFTYESYESGFMRRYRLSDFVFDEEWIAFSKFDIYTLCYDWINNNVLTSTYKPSPTVYTPSFYKFIGTYKDAKGNVLTHDIGPALNWNSTKYSIDSTASKGKYNAFILGLNKSSGNYDTIKTNVPPSMTINDINPKKYEYLKLGLNFVDTSYGASEPLKLQNISVDFSSLPEISINKSNFTFTPDTLLQGFTTATSLQVFNLGESNADSVTLKYYANNADSAFITNRISIPKDSSAIMNNIINTSTWSPSTLYNTKVIATMPADEFFTFNNIAEKSFFIARDSSKPVFNITFDGKEITNGDVISAKPEILITMKDDSPIPLDTSSFSTLSFDNVQLSFSRPDLKFSYTPYPNSQATIKWTPSIQDGPHTLEVLAKDPSGNFFDSVSHKYQFYVYNQPDLTNVFNYPNPFKNDTYFTFELRGQNAPEELRIRVFTVAGRLIKNIFIPTSALRVGFNKIYWDGRDADGDEVANGVYFYKIIAKNNGIVKTSTEKLAKIK
jgi:Peptidase family C25/Propeptide_C25